MGEQNLQDVDFFRDNLVLIGVVILGIFGYLLMLIRKRWKDGFVHPDRDKDRPA
jgi:hypothetical protein